MSTTEFHEGEMAHELAEREVMWTPAIEILAFGRRKWGAEVSQKSFADIAGAHYTEVHDKWLKAAQERPDWVREQYNLMNPMEGEE